jgi:pilus assembly protein FimV
MAIDKNKAIANAQRFTQKGQLDRALKEYQAIVAEDPEDVRIWLKIGDLFTKKGTVPQAVSTYARVAVYYSERGFFLKAVAVWKQILNIDPAYAEPT